MKKTKFLLAALATAALGLMALGLTGCGNAEPGDDHAHQYTCSMHPEVVQDEPGNCPKCGMKLIEKH